MNMCPIKIAIFESGRRQLEIAKNTNINPARLSLISNGWVTPNDRERRILSEELDKPVVELFPEKNDVTS
jgi:hypothetical protein